MCIRDRYHGAHWWLDFSDTWPWILTFRATLLNSNFVAYNIDGSTQGMCSQTTQQSVKSCFVQAFTTCDSYRSPMRRSHAFGRVRLSACSGSNFWKLWPWNFWQALMYIYVKVMYDDQEVRGQGHSNITKYTYIRLVCSSIDQFSNSMSSHDMLVKFWRWTNLYLLNHILNHCHIEQSQ